MDVWQFILTIICAALASTGLWTFLNKRLDRKDCKNEMLVGLGHDRIMSLGMRYIDRGYITQDEYENLYEYLYKPYTKLGGNGSAKHVMEQVDKLPVRKSRIIGDDSKC